VKKISHKSSVQAPPVPGSRFAMGPSAMAGEDAQVPAKKQHIAVVGSGISGLSAAWLLHRCVFCQWALSCGVERVRVMSATDVCLAQEWCSSNLV
jgi:hypothetical protein